MPCSSSRATSAGLHDGLRLDESIARAAATSGGAVFFAGCTVTIALVSLAVAGIPLVTTMGLMAAHRRRGGGARGADAAARAAGDPRAAHRLAAGPQAAHRRAGREGPVGKVGSRDRAAARRRRARGAGDPDPADDPAAVADAGTAGHRRAVDLHHGASGLRPDLQELRAGSERAAADRGQARSRRRRTGTTIRGWRRCRRTCPPLGRGGGHADPGRQGGHDRLLQRDLQDRTGGEARPPTRRTGCARRHSRRGEGHRHEGLRRWQHGRLRGPGVQHLQQAAAADPGGHRAQLRCC